MISSTTLQSFLELEYNPIDTTFILNIVLKLNGVMYEKWNSRIKQTVKD